jgi:hypothetical protein
MLNRNFVTKNHEQIDYRNKYKEGKTKGRKRLCECLSPKILIQKVIQKQLRKTQ